MLECAIRHSAGAAFELDCAFSTGAGVTAIFGPSGSGKTTVLESIAGLRRPRHARVLLDGATLCDSEKGINLPPEKRGIGAVFQDLLLFPHKTAAGNLRFAAKARGATAAPPFDAVVEVLELGPLLQRYPQQLSGGEQQRVAIGRALLRGPRLLLLDEPMAALDEGLKHRIITYVARIIDAWRIPVLFVSHNQAEVRRLAQWVVALERGKQVAEGPVDEVLAQPALLGMRHEARPMNLLRIEELRVEDGVWRARIGQQWLQLPPGPQAPEAGSFLTAAPGAIMLAREDAAGLSARNHLRGTVRQLAETAAAVYAAVDVGQLLWVEVTPAAAQELALAPGAPVICLLKTHSLQVLPDGPHGPDHLPHEGADHNARL